MATPNNLAEVTAVINEMSAAQVQELLELAESAPIELVKPPESGLTMMHVLDAYDSEFLLGEVLVTSAEVRLDGQHGFGLCIGEDADRALARACAEVLLQGRDELLKVRTEKLLVRAQREQISRRRREDQLIAATKVNFELMAGH